jgi:hypothetical protein
MRTASSLERTKEGGRIKRLESWTSEKRLKAVGLFNLQKQKRSEVINNFLQMNCGCFYWSILNE